jgi:hypothetical protein
MPGWHRLQLPDGCHWRDPGKVHGNVCVALQNILDRIQQANPDALGATRLGWHGRE